MTAGTKTCGVSLNGDHVSVRYARPAGCCREVSETSLFRAVRAVAGERYGPGRLHWNHDLWDDCIDARAYTYERADGVVEVAAHAEVLVGQRAFEICVKLTLTFACYVDHNDGVYQREAHRAFRLECLRRFGPGRLAHVGGLKFEYKPDRPAREN